MIVLSTPSSPASTEMVLLTMEYALFGVAGLGFLLNCAVISRLLHLAGTDKRRFRCIYGLALFVVCMADIFSLAGTISLFALDRWLPSKESALFVVHCKLTTYFINVMADFNSWIWVFFVGLRYASAYHKTLPIRRLLSGFRLFLIVFGGVLTLNLWILIAVATRDGHCAERPLRNSFTINRFLHNFDLSWSYVVPVMLLVPLGIRIFALREKMERPGSRIVRNRPPRPARDTLRETAVLNRAGGSIRRTRNTNSRRNTFPDGIRFFSDLRRSTRRLTRKLKNEERPKNLSMLIGRHVEGLDAPFIPGGLKLLDRVLPAEMRIPLNQQVEPPTTKLLYVNVRHELRMWVTMTAVYLLLIAPECILRATRFSLSEEYQSRLLLSCTMTARFLYNIRYSVSAGYLLFISCRRRVYVETPSAELSRQNTPVFRGNHDKSQQQAEVPIRRVGSVRLPTDRLKQQNPQSPSSNLPLNAAPTVVRNLVYRTISATSDAVSRSSPLPERIDNNLVMLRSVLNDCGKFVQDAVRN